MWFKQKPLKWHALENIVLFNAAIKENNDQVIYLFKHSTRCSISSMAKARLEGLDLPADYFYYLDLIAFREISNTLALELAVEHQSPQLIILKNGVTLGVLSHNGINKSNIAEILANN